MVQRDGWEGDMEGQAREVGGREVEAGEGGSGKNRGKMNGIR